MELDNTIRKWKWLYAPSSSALGLAFRTAFTSLFALYVALWMEMDSPFWAPLTVWMVALITPQESNAKAKWHLFGTILGTTAAVILIGLFPQEPFIFVILLASWVGGCCFVAAFLNNFRIHGMRVSAFTFALIAIDAIPDPNQIFDVAMARASYIILAIILQKTTTSIFVGDQKQIQITWLHDNLNKAIHKTCFILSQFFKGNHYILDKNRSLFSTFYQLNQKSEFADMAIAPHSHLGAHGRLILAIANNILLRTYCLQKLVTMNKSGEIVKNLPQQAASFFSELPNLITSQNNANKLLTEVKSVRRHLYTLLVKFSDQLAHCSDFNHKDLLFTEISIIYGSLVQLEEMLSQFSTYTILKVGSGFSYHINTYRNIRKARYNGLRVFIAIVLSGLIWEITAWDHGMQFLMYVCVVCAISSIAERPTIATKAYWKGACYAIITTGFINFLIIPVINDFEVLVFVLLPFMFVAGLAACHTPTALIAIAFNFFFFVLLAFNNQNRANESSFINLSFSLLAAIIFTSIICHLIFPVTTKKELLFTCSDMIKNLKKVSKQYLLPSRQYWINQQVSNLVYIVDDSKNIPSQNKEIFFYGAHSIILIGEQILKIRSFTKNNRNIDNELRDIIKNILYKLSKNPSTLCINQQLITYEYHRFLRYYSNLNNQESKKNLLPILSCIAIIKNQLYYYTRFTKLLYILGQKS
ncbi:FUSC family protein [Commensalibacter oyaizuii]|uniref:FUSC family protein n=1 Tax=Commensalibacter oyaizuii TaxID=3043873 RepID=A0ABT6PZK3_9PROT|nr:FUSC family protein [Commensalibacter sp. TBRC 16381]MDI2090145.1 FUSC family protein [Commensalibacter sp. TBRC 16381]